MANGARSPGGARRLLGLIAAGALVAGAGRAAMARPGEGPGPLPWRVGGPLGFTVDAAAFPDTQGHALEVYVRIPPSTLGSLTLDSAATGKLRLSARLKSGFAGKPSELKQEFEISPGDSVRDFGHVVLLRFPLRSGPQKLAVRLEDLRSRKRGLVYLGRNVAENAGVEGEFQVSVPKVGPDLSDIEFVWPVTGALGTAFRRGDRDVVPNADRLYGLHADDLDAYFTARGNPGDSRAWRWRARVLDQDGSVVAARESTEASALELEAEVTFDLTHEPAGGYELEVSAAHEGDASASTRMSKFSIAWRSESWFKNPRDVEDAVHLLLTPDDEQAFTMMQAGEQERLLDDYWRVRDPTPGTALNEAQEEFRQRVAIANRTYARIGSGPGMLSDMGRVFIRYGEPSEVLKQVIPTGDNTLSQVISDLVANEDRAVGDVHQKGLGSDMRPFEVWIYQGDIPPPVDADPRERRAHRRRLVFLFVDEQGLGQYTLRYSTE